LHCAALAFGLLITADSASAQSNFPIRNRASGLVADVVGAQPVILFKKNEPESAFLSGGGNR
jgi:hypothetical protein